MTRGLPVAGNGGRLVLDRERWGHLGTGERVAAIASSIHLRRQRYGKGELFISSYTDIASMWDTLSLRLLKMSFKTSSRLTL